MQQSLLNIQLLMILSQSFLADRIGPINTNILYAILSGLSSFLVWNFANSFGTLMAFSVIFGFFCGSYSALGEF